MDDEEYGRLDMISDHPIDERLMKNFSMLLAQVLHKDQTLLQHQRLLLMEERAVIARELHDSPPRPSYLKIQATLLKRSFAKGTGQDRGSHGADRRGTQQCLYPVARTARHLPPSIGDANLGEAIAVMLEQLKPQTHADIRLQYGLTDTDLEAGQHIHILQLIREAVLNAIKHASARHIDVSCETLADGNIQVQIADDGVGIRGASSAVNHYGLSIMNERASKLRGQLTISEPSPGHPHTPDLSHQPNKRRLMDEMKYSVLVVDDHPLMRKGIVQLLELEDNIDVVGEASNGTDAVAMAKESEPDLILPRPQHEGVVRSRYPSRRCGPKR